MEYPESYTCVTVARGDLFGQSQALEATYGLSHENGYCGVREAESQDNDIQEQERQAIQCSSLVSFNGMRSAFNAQRLHLKPSMT